MDKLKRAVVTITVPIDYVGKKPSARRIRQELAESAVLVDAIWNTAGDQLDWVHADDMRETRGFKVKVSR